MAVKRLTPLITRRGEDAVTARGMKPVWFNGEVFATCCDLSDLPVSLTPWREVSDREALNMGAPESLVDWLRRVHGSTVQIGAPYFMDR